MEIAKDLMLKWWISPPITFLLSGSGIFFFKISRPYLFSGNKLFLMLKLALPANGGIKEAHAFYRHTPPPGYGG